MYDEQGKVYTGYAPGLKVYAQASTMERAKRVLARVTTLFTAAAQRNPALFDSLAETQLHSDGEGKSPLKRRRPTLSPRSSG